MKETNDSVRCDFGNWYQLGVCAFRVRIARRLCETISDCCDYEEGNRLVRLQRATGARSIFRFLRVCSNGNKCLLVLPYSAVCVIAQYFWIIANLRDGINQLLELCSVRTIL